MRFMSLVGFQVLISSNAIKAAAEIFQQRHSNLAPPTCDLRALLRNSRNKNNTKTCRSTPDANQRAVEIAARHFHCAAQVKQSAPTHQLHTHFHRRQTLPADDFLRRFAMYRIVQSSSPRVARKFCGAFTGLEKQGRWSKINKFIDERDSR
jgi:hypothetical protein